MRPKVVFLGPRCQALPLLQVWNRGGALSLEGKLRFPGGHPGTFVQRGRSAQSERGEQTVAFVERAQGQVGPETAGG